MFCILVIDKKLTFSTLTEDVSAEVPGWSPVEDSGPAATATGGSGRTNAPTESAAPYRKDMDIVIWSFMISSSIISQLLRAL